MGWFDSGWAATLAGLLAGGVLGAAARSVRYCVMGALEDAAYGADFTRMRMLGVSAAVAIAGATLLTALGALDPLATSRLAQGFSPGAAILGGLLFGYGMALVGTCAFGALARVGGGDIRSLAVVSVIGVSAYVVTAGPLSPLRLWLAPPRPGGDGLAQMAGAALGVAPEGVGFALAAALLATAVIGLRGRAARAAAGWGAAVGAAVAFGWGATAALTEGFAVVPVQSLSFVEPTGAAMLYAMTEADLAAPGFAIGGVVGVVIGAAAAALLGGDFRWETSDDPRELRRQLIGGALMGVGGVLALGCTVGQGLTALSVLAPSAPVVMLAILIGARAGLFVLVEGLPGLRRPG
jgi:uncharacterized membrane protein YedE/YeeE